MPYAVTTSGKPMVLPYKSKKINDKVVIKTASVSHHTDGNKGNEKKIKFMLSNLYFDLWAKLYIRWIRLKEWVLKKLGNLMPSFGPKSKSNLGEAHPDLQKLFKKVVETYDCAVIEGYRGQEEQDSAYHSGKSKLKYPKSKHNTQPSLAVDVVPYPVDWEDTKQFYHFAGFVQGIAEEMGISLRWGGDWNSNRLFEDQSFHDLPHYELMQTE